MTTKRGSPLLISPTGFSARMAAPAASVPRVRRGGAVYRSVSLQSWRWPVLRPLLPLLRWFR
jgi:hypothetical protein